MVRMRMVSKELVEDLKRDIRNATDNNNEDEMHVATLHILSLVYERLFRDRIQEFRLLEIDPAKLFSEINIKNLDFWLGKLNEHSNPEWEPLFDQWLEGIRATE